MHVDDYERDDQGRLVTIAGLPVVKLPADAERLGRVAADLTEGQHVAIRPGEGAQELVDQLTADLPGLLATPSDAYVKLAMPD